MAAKFDRCQTCKKARALWKGRVDDYRLYCCWGCADDVGCSCDTKVIPRTVIARKPIERKKALVLTFRKSPRPPSKSENGGPAHKEKLVARAPEKKLARRK